MVTGAGPRRARLPHTRGEALRAADLIVELLRGSGRRGPPTREGARQARRVRPRLILTHGRDEEILRRNYGSSVLISPQRRKWAEMRNDPSGFVPRKCEYDAHKKTRHAGDCVATQTGHDKGWDGARPPLATDFRAQSSLCSLSDRLMSARVSPRVCLAKKKSATDGFRPRRTVFV